jgi:hypothetical protein
MSDTALATTLGYDKTPAEKELDAARFMSKLGL